MSGLSLSKAKPTHLDLGNNSITAKGAFVELGVNRMRASEDEDDDKERKGSGVLCEEEELMCLRRVILEFSDIFDALCWNIERQLKGWEVENETSDLAITVRREESSVGAEEEEDGEEEGAKKLVAIQKFVQLVHLDAMRECLQDGDEDGVVSHIPFLHLDRGVDEAEYRMVLQELLGSVLSRRVDYGDSWISMKEKLLGIYETALASNDRGLVEILQPLRLEIKRKLAQRSERVKSVDLHPTEPWILVSLYSGTVCIWNYQSQSSISQVVVVDPEAYTHDEVIKKVEVMGKVEASTWSRLD